MHALWFACLPTECLTDIGQSEVMSEPEMKNSCLFKQEATSKEEAELQPDVNSEEEPELQPDENSEEEPELQPDENSEEEPELQQDENSEEEPELQPDVNSEEEAELQPVVNSEEKVEQLTTEQGNTFLNPNRLGNSEKHLSLRKEADTRYRLNAERMRMKYCKARRKKVMTFECGDFVSVKIPRIDRTSTDFHRLPCVVVEVMGKVHLLYRLRYVTIMLMIYKQIMYCHS